MNNTEMLTQGVLVAVAIGTFIYVLVRGVVGMWEIWKERGKKI